MLSLALGVLKDKLLWSLVLALALKVKSLFIALGVQVLVAGGLIVPSDRHILNQPHRIVFARTPPTNVELHSWH